MSTVVNSNQICFKSKILSSKFNVSSDDHFQHHNVVREQPVTYWSEKADVIHVSLINHASKW